MSAQSRNPIFSSLLRLCPCKLLRHAVVGSFDGNIMMSSIEVFDPCCGGWINGEQMYFDDMMQEVIFFKNQGCSKELKARRD
ncbi:hypothetical protein PIB30_037151 [Stylosanthes scabra]|uniref:Uncharacterized protein n=1 Tax=Stylosanthes scabra TaxID=79078 RepID=A0ABU6SDQ7_9FABA|nr:hypothetical protein [Stylosanthes scabra]